MKSKNLSEKILRSIKSKGFKIINLNPVLEAKYILQRSGENFKKFLSKKILLIIKIPAKIIFTIVGFIYKKIGLSKYKVNPPNNEITIPPINGT